MTALDEILQRNQKQDYIDDTTDIITDMGDCWDRSQREDAARSFTNDYEGVSKDDAEEFIENNDPLFETGKAPAIATQEY